MEWARVSNSPEKTTEINVEFIKLKTTLLSDEFTFE